MTAQVFTDELRPSEALEALMARHGVLRVLAALLPVLLGLQGAARIGHPMSRHLARDIGLSYDPPAKTPWEYR